MNKEHHKTLYEGHTQSLRDRLETGIMVDSNLYPKLREAKKKQAGAFGKEVAYRLPDKSGTSQAQRDEDSVRKQQRRGLRGGAW